MNGKLGAFYIGKRQVGGFYDWQLKLNVSKGVEDSHMTAKVQSWMLSSWSYWLFKEVAPGTMIRLKLCSDEGLNYFEGEGKLVERVSNLLSTLVHTKLEITGSAPLKTKKVGKDG